MAIHRAVLAILVLALMAGPAGACPDVPTYPTQAAERVGERVVVMGTVATVRRFPRGRHVALEMVDPGTDGGAAPFVAFVRGERLREVTGEATAPAAVAWLRALKGKRVWIEGRVKLAKGRSRIVVIERDQVVALDDRGVRL